MPVESYVRAGSRRRSLPGRLGRLAWNGLAAMGVVFIVVSATPLVSWWAGRLAGPWNDPKGETMILLGAANISPDIMGLNSYWRAVYALRFYREGGFKRIVITGREVAPPMRDFLVQHGVPAEIITLEEKAGSTRENATETARLLAGAPGRKVLVTSDYHMHRARKCFEKAGLEVAPRPFPDARKQAARWENRWNAFLTVAIETVKIGYYRARGWI